MNYSPLTREELIRVIEGRGAVHRVPMLYQFWTFDGIWGENNAKVAMLKQKYPYDVAYVGFRIPDILEAPDDDPTYRFVNTADARDFSHMPLDTRVVIEDYTDIDEIIARFPSPDYLGLFPAIPPEDGRYRLGHWWGLFFERSWEFRGMAGVLEDMYLERENLCRLLDALADFYIAMLKRAKKECALDGVFFSDDMGTQTGPFFSPELFREVLKPYYKRIIDTIHALGMHVWLHSCGNIELLLPELIELGLDVIHPIQKHTMDANKIAREFGDKICILAGFDVQQTIPYGTPDECREEVRSLIDTFYRSDGRFMLTFGNGLTEDTPVQSIEAVMDETLTCGLRIRE